jgi:hypothetical protein
MTKYELAVIEKKLKIVEAYAHGTMPKEVVQVYEDAIDSCRKYGADSVGFWAYFVIGIAYCGLSEEDKNIWDDEYIPYS